MERGGGILRRLKKGGAKRKKAWPLWKPWPEVSKKKVRTKTHWTSNDGEQKGL